MLQRLNPARSAVQGLVLVPTRELASQVLDVLRDMGAPLGFDAVGLLGGRALDRDFRALERRPDAVFDLVAVAPNGGNAATAKQKADGVLKSMTGMGLPADRVSESEITSPTAATPEVHVYVQ